MKFKLPELQYDYNALERSIDARTMEIHHSKHHGGYTAKLNDAVDGSEWSEKSIEEILSNVSKLSAAVRNNGGGYFNHSLFWQVMSPDGGGTPKGDLADALKANFGSFDDFKKQFSNAAATRFGSGWAWLVKQDDKLIITSTPNQDNPLMDIAETKGHPILGLDVWEHAYYLRYQNKRPDYIAAFWDVVNWAEAERRFKM